MEEAKRSANSRKDYALAYAADIAPIRSSPISFHGAFNRPRQGVAETDEVSNTLRGIADKYADLPELQTKRLNSRTSTAVNDVCEWTPAPDCSNDIYMKYRSSNGACNNLQVQNYGRTGTPFTRVLSPAYSGI